MESPKLDYWVYTQSTCFSRHHYFDLFRRVAHQLKPCEGDVEPC